MGRWDWIGKDEWMVAIALLALTGCSLGPATVQPRTIQIQQKWLQPGDKIADHRIAAGLGDVSIELNGDSVYAPFAGRVQPNMGDCILFSSPDVPAYLFRLCGLGQPRLGDLQRGTAIGSGSYLHFATLRKQQDGSWALVEPSSDMLQRFLKPSS
jgi:hypothetical protein